MTAAQATVTGIKVGSRWLRMSSEGRARGTSQCIGCGTQKKGSSKAGPACHRRGHLYVEWGTAACLEWRDGGLGADI